MDFLRPSVIGLLAITVLHSQTPPTLTLASALALAEAANLNVRLSRETVAQAGAFAEQQLVAVLPVINATGGQTRTQSVSLNSNVATEVPTTNRFDGRLNGTFNVLNPVALSAYSSARTGLGVAQADLATTVQSALASVAQSYFAQLHDVRRIAVLDANIARARSLLDLAQNQMAAGVATRIDVTRAEAALATAQQARLQQETVVFQSGLQLQRLLDLDPTQPLLLGEFVLQRQDSIGLPLGLEKAFFERRPEYVRAEKAVEQARQDVRTANYERLPSLAVGAQYGYASANFYDDAQKREWFAGATVTVPVFDGLRAGADKRLALSRARQQEYRLRSLEIQIAAEIKLAAQDAASRFRQIGVAEKSLALAQEQLRLAEQRYQQGVADNLEVVDAQNAVAVASDGLNDAFYFYNSARVELARTKGDVKSILNEQGP